ncbi:MAG: phytoene synthase [Rhodobacterales bacterium]|nr:MAG: phytoene synthase [Rhodobacterales bacterium]
MEKPGDDDLNACAAIVEKGDPERFMATMAAPVAARAKLFPLYAFNVEMARAPWVTQEAMIAEIRLQWWHDALGEIAQGGSARRHEVVTPLATILTPATARMLQALVDARQHDIYPDPFTDMAALEAYLDQTSGHLMVAACDVLAKGGVPETLSRQVGRAQGLANLLRALPALTSLGRSPLPPNLPSGTQSALQTLAKSRLNDLRMARARRGEVARPAHPALLSAWASGPVLKHAVKAPEKILAGALAPRELSSRTRLILRAATGYW